MIIMFNAAQKSYSDGIPDDTHSVGMLQFRLDVLTSTSDAHFESGKGGLGV